MKSLTTGRARERFTCPFLILITLPAANDLPSSFDFVPVPSRLGKSTATATVQRRSSAWTGDDGDCAVEHGTGGSAEVSGPISSCAISCRTRSRSGQPACIPNKEEQQQRVGKKRRDKNEEWKQ